MCNFLLALFPLAKEQMKWKTFCSHTSEGLGTGMQESRLHGWSKLSVFLFSFHHCLSSCPSTLPASNDSLYFYCHWLFFLVTTSFVQVFSCYFRDCSGLVPTCKAFLMHVVFVKKVRLCSLAWHGFQLCDCENYYLISAVVYCTLDYSSGKKHFIRKQR